MSIAGSSLLSRSSTSLFELPNLPGIKRAPSRIVALARAELRRSSTASLQEEGSVSGAEDDSSFISFLDSSSKILDMNRSLAAFPSTASAFNDISGRYSLKSQDKDRLSKSRSLPFCSLDTAPAFVVNSSEKVCRFVAYFTEQVPENLVEPTRSRKVEITYFLEDDTVEIVEPKQRNSGLVQGRVLKRHQVYKPGTKNPYYLEDFKSGNTVTIYDRTYTIISCNPATEKFLEELGEVFGPQLPLPADFYDPAERSSNRSSRGRSSNPEIDPSEVHNSKKITGFHKYGRQVLRFYGVWDSQGMLFGDEIQVRLHYVLADDTIEILPTYTRNSGRDKGTMLLKRTKVMRVPEPSLDGGGSTLSGWDEGSVSSRPSTTTFNDAGSTAGRSSSLSPTRKLAPSRPYHWSDLRIGDQIPVAAMKILLIDADGFTRQFFQEKGMPLADPIVLPKKEYTKQEITIPPHTGFGSEIDSLTSCKGSLIPLPPHKDGAKVKAFQGMILRYLATLESTRAADASRSFIVQVHLEDDTIQVLEPPQRNSGHKGGVFLNRGAIKSHDGNAVVQPQDIFCGAVVPIYGNRFVIHDADEFTMRHMEENKKLWINSNLATVVSKLKSRQEVISRIILTTPGLAQKNVTLDDIADILKRAGLDLVKQEIVTMFRVLDPLKVGTIKLTKVLKFLMSH